MTIAKAHWLLNGGKWIEVKETMPVTDKYTGETIGTVPVRRGRRGTRRSPRKPFPATPGCWPTGGSASLKRRASCSQNTRTRMHNHLLVGVAMVEERTSIKMVVLKP